MTLSVLPEGVSAAELPKYYQERRNKLFYGDKPSEPGRPKAAMPAPKRDPIPERKLKTKVYSIDEVLSEVEEIRKEQGTMKYSALDIMRDVATRHGFTLDELRSHRRDTKIVAARHEAIYLLSKLTSMSFPEMGRVMGRDHTTILHGLRTYHRRNNLPPPEPRRSWTPQEAEASAVARMREDTVKRMIGMGYSPAQVAARIGSTANAVYGLVYRSYGREAS